MAKLLTPAEVMALPPGDTKYDGPGGCHWAALCRARATFWAGLPSWGHRWSYCSQHANPLWVLAPIVQAVPPPPPQRGVCTCATAMLWYGCPSARGEPCIERRAP